MMLPIAPPLKNQLFSRFDADRLRKSVNLLAIAVVLIIIALMVGLTDNLITITMLTTGLVMFFYAVLYPWGKAKYYAIMGIIFLVLFLLELFAGIDILVRMANEGRLSGHRAEDVAMPVGMVLVTGVLAGLIGFISRIRGGAFRLFNNGVIDHLRSMHPLPGVLAVDGPQEEP